MKGMQVGVRGAAGLAILTAGLPSAQGFMQPGARQ